MTPRWLTLRQIWLLLSGGPDRRRCLRCLRGSAALVLRGQVFVFCPRCRPHQMLRAVALVDGWDEEEAAMNERHVEQREEEVKTSTTRTTEVGPQGQAQAVEEDRPAEADANAPGTEGNEEA